MDGEDLSSYDTVGDQESRNIDDQESLSKLEWELASESGRLTGKVGEWGGVPQNHRITGKGCGCGEGSVAWESDRVTQVNCVWGR